MAKNVTTTSIAKRAGVSQSTVSRVINNYRGINRVKRESVLAAMRELGYYANRNVKRRVGIVICPLPEQKNMMALEFFGNQIAAQEACLQEAEAESTVINLAAGAASLGLTPSRLQELSGVILLNAPSVGLLNSLKEKKIPFVVNTGAGIPGGIVCDTVGPDEAETCRIGCEYLLARRPGFGVMISVHNAYRIDGYQQELRRRGLPPIPKEDIHIVPSTDIAHFIDATHRLIRSGRRLPALIVDFYDAAAAGRSILAFSGIRVPEDILLFTYSHSTSQDEIPALLQDPRTLGRKAARRMLEILDDPDDPPHHIRIPMTLVNPSDKGETI